MDTVGIVGGTGPHGRGIALRLRESGYRVLVGSRDAQRARDTIARLPAPHTERPGTLVGVDNATAARDGDVVIVATPWDGFGAVGRAFADDFAGKVVISCATPFTMEEGRPIPVRVPEGSAAELLQRLCPNARVVSGFQNVSAVRLAELATRLDDDVLLCGDDPDAVAAAAVLVRAVGGLRPIHAGPLRLAAIPEDLTALLISVNQRYGAHASIALTGVTLPTEDAAE